MLEIERRRYIFKEKEIWFANFPFEVKGFDSVVFHSCKNRVDIKGFKRNEFPTLVIDLKESLNTIWKNMKKSSCRYFINKAIKKGIEIRINKDWEEFYRLNYLFRKKKRLPQSLMKLEEMKKYGTLFTAKFNREIIGGQLYLENKNNIRWLLGASKRLEVSKEKSVLISCANRLIIWEAIKYAKKKGIKKFDLGGYYTSKKEDIEKEKINIFKKSFGGKLVTQYIYQKDYSKTFTLVKTIYKIIRRSL